MVLRWPFASLIRTRWIGLVWSIFLKLYFVQMLISNFLWVNSWSGSFIHHIIDNWCVANFSRIEQRNIFGCLVMRVGNILCCVIVGGIGQVGEVGKWIVLVDLVTRRVVGWSLCGYLVRRRRTWRKRPTINCRVYYARWGLGLNRGPAWCVSWQSWWTEDCLLNGFRRVVHCEQFISTS